MKKLIAVIVLGLYLVRHFILKFLNHLLSALPINKSDKAEKVLSNYANDDIRAVPKQNATDFEDLQRCIRCGICDSLCDATKLMSSQYLHGPSLLASTHSRSLPDIKYTKAYIDEFDACKGCNKCMNACPTGVPIKKIVNYMKVMS